MQIEPLLHDHVNDSSKEALLRRVLPAAALSLAAVLLFSSPGNAQSPTLARGTPLQVTAKATPQRDRNRPYTFTTRGRIVPPPRYCAPGVNPGAGAANCVPIVCPPGFTTGTYCFLPGRSVICSGIVAVRFQKRSTTISARNVRVRPDCTYQSRVIFRARVPTRTGLLRVRARFQGNVVLLPRTASTRTVRAG